MAIRRELVVEAVCEAQDIQVTDADVEAQVREDAERSAATPTNCWPRFATRAR